MPNLGNPASRPAFQIGYDKLRIVYIIILSCPEHYCKPQLHPENDSGLLEMGLKYKAIHYRTLQILLKHEKGELKVLHSKLTGAHSLCDQCERKHCFWSGGAEKKPKRSNKSHLLKVELRLRVDFNFHVLKPKWPAFFLGPGFRRPVK